MAEDLVVSGIKLDVKDLAAGVKKSERLLGDLTNRVNRLDGLAIE